jgi:hypothetical protein
VTLDIDSIEARALVAAEGPWMVDRQHPEIVLKPDKPGDDWDGTIIATLPRDDFDLPDFANAAFIAHAREDVPALVAEVRRLRAALEEAQRR